MGTLGSRCDSRTGAPLRAAANPPPRRWPSTRQSPGRSASAGWPAPPETSGAGSCEAPDLAPGLGTVGLARLDHKATLPGEVEEAGVEAMLADEPYQELFRPTATNNISRRFARSHAR